MRRIWLKHGSCEILDFWDVFWSRQILAFPRTAQDVSTAIKFAVANNLEIAVKGSGNNPHAYSSVEDGLIVDMANMKDIHIDKENNQVTISGGCRWGEVYTALDEVDLMCAGGGAHVVGVGGHLTGGGYGPYSRLGMACDFILSATVVVADGRILTASDSENADLFFGIRGGSYYFGVVTQFVLRTFPRLGPYTIQSLVFPASVFVDLEVALLHFLDRDYGELDLGTELLPFIYILLGPPPQHPPLTIVNFIGTGKGSNIPDTITRFRH